ncbi:uncharacterized protein LOC142239505 [Haematobia irritans]|uniref:uncharacterized protein LOC142239505 n=1 Tax=Haematobia irritans TaxID=7368 RepID=UPI003F50665E
MSDVEKAISGLIEDEDLMQQQIQHQHQQQQQQHQSILINKSLANSYNTKSLSGNNLIQQQQQQQKQSTLSQHQQLQYHHRQKQKQQKHKQKTQPHHRQQQQQQKHHYITDTKYTKVCHNGCRTSNLNNCLSRALKLLFSTPGLVVMVIGYTIMGALVFPLLEAPQDISKSAIIAKSREECLKELWIITEKLNVLYERNWTMLVHEQLRRFEGTIVAATRNVAQQTANSAGSTASSSSAAGMGGGSGNTGSSGGLAHDASATTTALGRFGGSGNFIESNDFTATRWSFSEALLYSVTVITTIGHGSLTPRTTGGKIATILYALIGVPLMLMCLSSLGAILAEALQCTYARLCCRWPQYGLHDGSNRKGGKMNTNGTISDENQGGDVYDDDDDDDDVDLDADGLRQKPQQKRQHRRLARKETLGGNDGNGSGGTVIIGVNPLHDCDYQDHHKHGSKAVYMTLIFVVYPSSTQYHSEDLRVIDVYPMRWIGLLHLTTTLMLKSTILKELGENEKMLRNLILFKSLLAFKVSIRVLVSLVVAVDTLLDKNKTNCKNCKYDAIVGDTNTSISYDNYKCNNIDNSLSDELTAAIGGGAAVSGVTSSPTTKLGLKDGKLNQQHQLSACMQLKMSPTLGITTGQQQQQQHQQQQYYQQRPDVMLMTTGNKLSSMAASGTSCRLVIPNSSSGPGITNIPATPRYYSPPMATYHIVSSASANSSPTHQQAIRHYIIPPSATLQTSSGPVSSGGTHHHFMAVPTNMLRFQTSAIHCGPAIAGGMTTSNLSINPLASGSTTTVYFPIVTPAGAVGQNPLALSGNANSAINATTSTSNTNTNTTTTSLASSLALTTSVQQPLVKYHTIQMPHRRKQSLTLASGGEEEGPDGSAREDEEMLPPPPPAYQTATIHGIRRAKFLTKPLPQEINTLLHESDISCRLDLSTTANNINEGGEQQQQQQQQQSITTIPTSVSAIATTKTTTSHPVTQSTDVPMTQHQQQYHHQQHQYQYPQQQQQQQIVNNLYSNTSTICAAPPSSTLTNNSNSGSGVASGSVSGNVCESLVSTSPLTQISTHHSSASSASAMTGDIVDTQCSSKLTTAVGNTAMTSSIVDIMEDEEELEQQRLGNCPHGTPSRVPLLTCNTSTSTQEDKSAARSFLQATAATIQRHASGFHRQQQQQQQHHHPPSIGQRKSLIINSKGECNLASTTSTSKRRRNSAICYRDHMDTSEDDEYPLEGENMYKLKNLHHHHPAGTTSSSHQPHMPQQTDKHMHKHHHHHATNQDDVDCNSLVSYDGSASSSGACSTSSSQLPQVPMLVVLIILIFYVSLGTVIFALWENWSLIDGAYFCFVTLTTIGYGDFVPLRTFQGPEIQLFACCAYLLLGLVLVAMSFSILETQLIWKCKRLAVRLKLTKE